MVHLYFFNPLPKLGFLGRLFFRGSKRLLKPADAGRYTPPAKSTKSRVPTTPFYDNEIRAKISGGVFHDPDYYKDDSEGGFCVFRVENTLFKVICLVVVSVFLAHHLVGFLGPSMFFATGTLCVCRYVQLAPA